MNKKTLTIIFLLLAMRMGSAGDDFEISAVGGKFGTDFNCFTGTFTSLPAGFAVSSSGLSLMDTSEQGYMGVSTGGVTTGGCYAWMLDNNDMAMGCQPTADKFTPGFFMVSVSNATGKVVKSISVKFDVVCLNNEDRSSSLNLFYSCDGTQFVAVAGCSYISPAAESSAITWEKTPLSGRFWLKPSLQPGGRLWLRWYLHDAGGSGSRDEYGIDNLAITLHEPDGTVISVR
jgi:hypothetical protein